MGIGRVIGSAALALILSLSSVFAAGSDVADAVMKKNQQAVRALLHQKTDVNAPQTDGATAIHWAARWDDLEVADLLIRGGANVNAATREGSTPLSLASINGSAAMVEKLLKAGANPNARLLEGETALMIAARTGKADAVKVLLDNGADINAKESLRQTTALMWAVSEGHPAVTELLIARGADVNAKTKFNAAPGKKTERGEQYPATGSLTALVFAARQNDLESARMLVAAGANVNEATADSNTPMHVAVINGNYELAAFLLAKGADPNAANFQGFTPIFLTVANRNFNRGTLPVNTADKMEEIDFVKMLLDAGANPNDRRAKENTVHRGGDSGRSLLDERGATPFLRAASNGDLALMRMLLNYGADPNFPTEGGTTPLMAAAGLGWAMGISQERSPEETVAAMKLLVDLGADVNATNPEGRTALMGASHKGADLSVQYLVDQGARLDARDNVKGTAGT